MAWGVWHAEDKSDFLWGNPSVFSALLTQFVTYCELKIIKVCLEYTQLV